MARNVSVIIVVGAGVKGLVSENYVLEARLV